MGKIIPWMSFMPVNLSKIMILISLLAEIFLMLSRFSVFSFPRKSIKFRLVVFFFPWVGCVWLRQFYLCVDFEIMFQDSKCKCS